MPVTEADWAVLDRNIAAWNHGDLEAWLALVHPTEASWRAGLLKKLVGEESYYAGQEGMRRFWLEWRASWEEYRIEVVDREEVGGRMLVQVQVTARGSSSGIEVTRDMWWLVDVRDALLSHGASFLTEEDARAAATRP